MTLGERICKKRKALGISQEQLATELGVSRQSVSKWETDTATPEIEKLIRMGELFGVTLDELVKGEDSRETGVTEKFTAENQSEIMIPEMSKSKKGRSTLQTILGVILLCFGALVFFIISLLGGALSGILFSLPFLLCGIVAFTFRKSIGLWCGWAVFFSVDLYMGYGTALSRRNILHTFIWTQEMNYMILILSWVSFLILLILGVLTVKAYFGERIWDKTSLKQFICSVGAFILFSVIEYALAKWQYGIYTGATFDYLRHREVMLAFRLFSFILEWAKTATTVYTTLLVARFISSRRKRGRSVT